MMRIYEIGLDALGAAPLPSRKLVVGLIAAKVVGGVLLAMVLL